jgi:hypothetical protein
MPPGSTSRFLASITSSAAPRSSPNATILPPRIPTSQATVSLAVATRPPRMMVSSLVMVCTFLLAVGCNAAAAALHRCTLTPADAACRSVGSVQLR